MVKSFLVDKFGMLASSMCAVHCLLTAFLPGILLILGLDFLMTSKTEWIFSLFAVALAGLALWTGYKKHNSKLIALTFIIGMTGILASRFIEEAGHGHEESHHKEELHHHE